MMMYKKLAVAGLLFGLAVNANAVPVTFDLAGGPASSVTLSDLDLDCTIFGCGVSVELNQDLDLLSRTLSAGESWTFDFFTFNFSGWGNGSGTVTAQLGFDSPDGAPVAGGSGYGTFETFFVITNGDLVWNTQPGSFLLADGTSYSIWFQNLDGVDLGDTTVEATVQLNDEPNVSVPEPGSLALLGLGLLGFGFATRRRYMNRA